MIPTTSAERLPDVALPDGNSLERLAMRLYRAARQFGSKEEADKIETEQIKNG